MPAISLAHIDWSTPDGNPVLSDLNLNIHEERVGIVGRNGVGKSTLLKLVAGDLQPASGRVIGNGRLSVLRQLVQIAPDETVADLFGTAEGLALLRKAEAGEASAEELAEADWTLESRITSALAQLGLSASPERRLATLSGGERTRAALAAMIFSQPDFLLLDEPTNNLDREGRNAVRGLLREWRAGAILVSHDRELLEEMDSIVELTGTGARHYGGNWSHYSERKAIERTAADHDLAMAERQMADVRRKAQTTAERKQRRDAADSRRGARSDLPRILLGARKDNAEKSGGSNARLADRQRAEAERRVERARDRIEVIETMSVRLPSTGLAPSRVVLEIRDLTAGYAAECPILTNVSLSMIGPQRTALTGPNGAGKSTLLNVIAGHLAPWTGWVRVHTPFALFDQRVSILDPAQSIASNYARLNPGSSENGCRAALARFQFRAEAADRLVASLSGGQMLRAGLACVLGGAAPPPFLILDEPTNHLDLESMAAVEAGLSGYDGALLVVSHDAAFLDNIGVTSSLTMTALPKS